MRLSRTLLAIALPITKLFERSILRRLLLAQVVGLLLYAAVTFALTYGAVMRLGSGDFDREMAFSAEALAKLGERDADDPPRLAHTVAMFEEISYDFADLFGPFHTYRAVIQIWDGSGNLMARTTAAPTIPIAPLEPGIAEATFGGERWRVATARGPDGRVFAQFAESARMRDEMVRLIFNDFFVQPLLFALPLLLGLSLIASLQGLRPLRALARQIRKRSATELSRVDMQPVYSETQPLVNALNDLIERIEKTLAHERDFLADAAHELRTPLAALQAQLHVLVHSSTAAERSAAEEDMRGAITRASALLRQLLAIARLESDARSITPRRLDLAALLQERVAAFGKAAIDKSIEIELNAPVSLDAEVDHDVIVSLIDNLLDNAIRYVPAGGEINVALTPGDAKITFSVADNGPGIPAEQRERAFERFFRLPGNDEPGSGLGLAIARRAVLLHGGNITLGEGIAGRGLKVEVTLPVSSA